MSFSQQDSSEIESLKAQLAQKDRQISELKSRLSQSNENSYTGSSARIQDVLRREVESLQESISSTDIVGMNQLSSILNNQNLENQISSLISFLKSRLNSIPRLCAQLRGHVDFLTRLASSPKLQSLFLISDHTGSIFLPETARQLLLEQAARTSQLIAEYPQLISDPSFKHSSTINTSISFDAQSGNIDPNERLQSIKKLLSDKIHDPEELSSLLLQEVMISSSLQRISSEANDKIKQITKCLERSLPSNQSKHQQNNNFDILIEEEEEDNGEFGNKNNNKNDDFNFDKALHLAQKMANLASKNQNLTNDDNNQLNSSENSHKYSNHYDNNNNKYENNIRSNRNKSSSSITRADSTSIEWVKWARRLYYGLTQLPAESQDDRNLQIAIEEAALTSIGTQILQNRLKSLRIQKSVMSQPVVRKSQGEIGFKSPLICVVSCIRMIKRAYSSNAYTTKRKASKWSRKNVLNE